MTRESAKMRIIGIDPGYAITGYGIIDKTGSKFEVVDYGAIETKAGVDFPLRLLAINDKIKFLLEQYKPEYMSIEELFMGHNHTTVIGTAQARGAVLVEAARAVYFGNIECWSDEYIRFNGYGNLESLSESQAANFADDFTDKIYEHEEIWLKYIDDDDNDD